MFFPECFRMFLPGYFQCVGSVLALLSRCQHDVPVGVACSDSCGCCLGLLRMGHGDVGVLVAIPRGVMMLIV